jgi:hypothetical protein
VSGISFKEMTTTKPKRKPLSYRSLDILIAVAIMLFLGHPLYGITFFGLFIGLAKLFDVFPEGYVDSLRGWWKHDGDRVRDDGRPPGQPKA